MIMKDFINACKNSNQKKAIEQLRQLKSSRHIESLYNKPTLWNNTIPLFEAAKLDYYDVVKFLVDELKVNPYEKIFVKGEGHFTTLDILTADDESYSCDRNKIVLYLIEHMTEFNIDPKTGNCISLYNCIRTKRYDIFLRIISKKPALVQHKNKENTSLLALASSFGSVETVKYLIANDGNGEPRNNFHSSNIRGQVPFGYALCNLNPELIKIFLQAGVNPVVCRIGNSFVSTLKLVIDQEKNENKLACVNILLAAGAGLNKLYIPQRVYTLLKIDKTTQEKLDFLLKAEFNGQNKLLTTLKQVQAFIKNSQWHFENELLARAALKPEISETVYGPKLLEIFPSQALLANSSEIESDTTTVDQHPCLIIKKEEIINLKPRTLLEYMGAFDTFLIPKGKMLRSNLVALKNGENHQVPVILKEYFSLFSAFLEYCHHNQGPSIRLDRQELTLYKLLLTHITVLYDILFDIEDNQDIHEVIEMFYDEVYAITKSKKNLLLKENPPTLYNYMLLKSLQSRSILAQNYLNQGKESLALNEILKSMQIQKELVHYHHNDEKNQIISKAFLIAATVYASHGWFHKACDTFTKGLAREDNWPVNDLVENFERILSVLPNNLSCGEAFPLLCLLSESINNNIKGDLSVRVQILKAKIEDLLNSTKLSYQEIMIEYFSKNFEKYGVIALDEESGNFHLMLNDQHQFENNLSKQAHIFIKKNKDIQFNLNENMIIFNENYIQSFQVKEQLEQFFMHFIFMFKVKILPEPSQCSQSALETAFAGLTLDPDTYIEKLKTKGIPDPNKSKDCGNKDIKIQEEGFTQVANSTPPIAIYFANNAIPNNTLFITMPLNNPLFTPFLALMQDSANSQQYHPIKGIAAKGKNQQGAKLSSQWVTNDKNQREKVDIVRLKVLGADGKGKLRATGYKKEQFVSSDSRLLKLYEVSTVVEKKKEKHKP